MSCYSPSPSSSSSSSPTRTSPAMINHTDTDNDRAPSTSPRMTPLPPIELPLPSVPFSIVHFPPPPPHPLYSISPSTSPSLQPTPSSSPPVSDRRKSQNTGNNGVHHKKRTPSLSHSSTAIDGIHSPAAKTASERETHRRLSHSAIEKRRRERINDKIDQLKHLIPSCCPTPNTLPSASMHQPLHKLSVLQAAIDYIHQLHTQLIHHAPHLDALLLQQQQQKKLSSDVELAKILSHARRQHEQQMDHPPSLLHSP
ncbi:unnamed protein product [Absidia cylindrospora]